MFGLVINTSFTALLCWKESVMFTQGMKFVTCPVAMGTAFFCSLNWSLKEKKIETYKWLMQLMLIK